MDLVKVQLKSKCKHRMPALDGGLGKEYGPGSVLKVTPDEVRDFGDKFDVLHEEPKPVGPVVAEALPEVNATAGAIALAAEKGVDLAKVEGTGRDWRVLKSDVEAHLERGDS